MRFAFPTLKTMEMKAQEIEHCSVEIALVNTDVPGLRACGQNPTGHSPHPTAQPRFEAGNGQAGLGHNHAKCLEAANGHLTMLEQTPSAL